jgi:hypothetical protein
VGFLVLDSKLAAGPALARFATGSLWDAVKEYAHPYFERWRLDLHGPLDDLRRVLPALAGAAAADPTRAEAIAASVALGSAAVSASGLRIVLRADVPLLPAGAGAPRAGTAPPATGGGVIPAPEAPLTPEEYARFAASVQAGSDATLASDRQALLAILLDARRSMLDLLDPTRPRPPPGADPVRELFVDTWRRLAPVVRRIASDAPGEQPWRWLGFVAGSDALVALDKLGPASGVELSAAGLRRLARVVAPATTTDPVSASDAVDAELRAIFGFGPPLELPPEDGGETPPSGRRSLRDAVPLAWAFVEPEPWAALAARLRGWAPARDELDRYLPAMRTLLRLAAERTRAAHEGGIADDRVFDDMVLATAWKESCWRQFVRRRGKVEPLRSSVGALGVMQVNPRVWRGFYDVGALGSDAGYNARAGAEILLHYFEDFALARGEQRTESGIDGAVRATYAAYNGGPGHLGRWRRKSTPQRLRRIDEAFWRYYVAVRAGRELEVASCFGP